MKLRIKILLYIGLTLCGLVSAISLFSYYVILSSFNNIEENQAIKNGGRLAEIIKKELSRIETLTNDWALWDETYSFAGNSNPTYIETNFQDSMVSNLNVNAIILMDSDGKIIYSTAIDPEMKTKVPLPVNIIEAITTEKELFIRKDGENTQIHGILMTKDVPLLLAARSILTSKLEGPPRGVLIFAVFIDNAFIDDTGRQMRRDFTFERCDRKPSPELAEAMILLRNGSVPITKLSGNETITTFVPFLDIHGKESLIARIEMPREIFNEGKIALLTFIGGIIISACVIYLLIIFILERAILGKIRNFTKIFSNIRQVSDLTLRVESKGSDEIAQLGNEINNMLSALEQSKTTQQYTEISMVNNEKRYQLIIEQAPIGIITCHLDESFRTVNKSFCDILGYSPAELLGGKKIKDITFPEDYAPVEGGTGHQEKDLLSNRYEKRFVRKDGKIINVLMLVQVYRNLLGDPQYIIGTVQDITEQLENQKRQAKLEEELRHAQQLESIGRLAGGFAHDLNNFLVPILAYTDLLISVMPKTDPMYAGVLEIKNSAERAKSLSQKFLALSSKQMLEVTPLDINDIIKSFKSVLNRLIREDIKIEYKLSPDISMIKGDYTQIEQVIMNLAVNAKDAMLKGGTLRFETYNETLSADTLDTYPPLKAGRYVVMKVSDTGTGISKKAMEHLFEAFFTTKERGKGTGLGLSMVHGIVNQHKGGIRVLTAENRGTTFMIYLPVSDEDIQQASRENMAESDKVRMGQGEVILLVEDEPSVLRIVSSELKRNGYSVIEAESGPNAIELTKQAPDKIDILLTDVIMPDMDGKELYGKLLEIKPDLKVLYMSGHTYDILSQHDIQAPDAQFISKPFSMEILRKKINNLIDS